MPGAPPLPLLLLLVPGRARKANNTRRYAVQCPLPLAVTTPAPPLDSFILFIFAIQNKRYRVWASIFPQPPSTPPPFYVVAVFVNTGADFAPSFSLA